MSADQKTISVDNVRNLLLGNHGKVTEKYLLASFPDVRSSEEETKKRAREELKEILQQLTSKREEDGVKYIVLDERYRSNVAYKNANIRTTSTSGDNEQPASPENRQKLPSPSNGKKLSKTFSLGDDSPNQGRKSPKSSSPSYGKKLSKTYSLGDSPKESRKSVPESPSRKPLLKSRLSAVEGLKQVFQVRSESVESLASNDSGGGDVEDPGACEMSRQEKEWMMASCGGNLHVLKDLLLNFPNLLTYKDFAFGYTALHWAAKLGRNDIVEFIAESHQQQQQQQQQQQVPCEEGDEDAWKHYLGIQSHAGFTPLHIAAMCGKDDVILYLIRLGASIDARDYNGYKPKQLVKESVADKIRYRLGWTPIADKRTILQTSVNRTFNRSFSIGEESQKHKKYKSSPLASRKLALWNS